MIKALHFILPTTDDDMTSIITPLSLSLLSGYCVLIHPLTLNYYYSQNLTLLSISILSTSLLILHFVYILTILPPLVNNNTI